MFNKDRHTAKSITFKTIINVFSSHHTTLNSQKWIGLHLILNKQTQQDNQNDRIGSNILSNRLACLNNIVLLKDLNDCMSTFELKYKNHFCNNPIALPGLYSCFIHEWSFVGFKAVIYLLGNQNILICFIHIS